MLPTRSQNTSASPIRGGALILATGAVLAMGASASAIEIYGVDNLNEGDPSNEIFMFDSADPANTQVVIGETNVADAGFTGLDFDGSGNLWGYVGFGTTPGLYSIDTDTGAATVVGTLSGQGLGDIAYNPTDGVLYGVDGENLYSINTSTGAVTLVAALNGIPGALPLGLGCDSDGNFYLMDVASDVITKGGVTQGPCVALTVDANFSQGITVDWNGDNTGYHAALGNAPGFFSELYTFGSDCGAYTLVDNFGTGAGEFPLIEAGDLAIPVSGFCPPSLCPADLNGDNEVGVDDLLDLLAVWGTEAAAGCIDPADPIADVNDLLALLAAWGSCPEPPDVDNDDCDEPMELGVITTTTVIMSSLIDATLDGVGSCDGTPNDGAGVWFSVTGNGEQVIVGMCHPDNAGITFDARINVYCGTCNALQCIATGDDSGCAEGATLPDGVGFCAAEGTTYYILVHMAQGGTADDFALVLDTNGFTCDPDIECLPVEGDFCDKPLEITNTVTPFSTIGANTDGPTYLDETCGNNDNNDQTFGDIWYTYTVPCDGVSELTISTCADVSVNGENGNCNFDSDLVLYGPYASVGAIDCDPDLLNNALYGCNDDDTNNDTGCGGGPAWQSTIRVPVSGGEVYLIRVGGWGAGDEGTGNLLVACADPADAACCTSSGCADTSPEDCANQGGQWNQGIECDSIGVGGSDFNCDDLVVSACCLPDGTCAEISGTECAAQCGIFFEGETCDSFTCPTGACCVGGVCTDGVSQAECSADGGIWYEGEICDNVTCGADADYQYDNGTSETAVGAGGGDFAWGQRFIVVGGGNATIDEIITQWGTPGGTSGVSDGDTAGWAIYQGADGNGCSGINSATLLAQGTVTVDGASIESDVQQAFAVTPTVVTGEFYIVCWVTTADGVGAFPSPVDTDTPQPPGNCFHAFGAGGSFDPADPSGFSELSVVTGVWVLRANAQ